MIERLYSILKRAIWSLIGSIAQAALVVAIVCLIGWGSWRAYSLISTDPLGKDAFYRSYFPEQIELGTLLEHESDFSPFVALIGIPQEVCGGAVFELRDSMIEKLRSRGIEALEGARASRGGSRARSLTYDNWQESPVPRDWQGEGWPRGISCMGPKLADIITKEVLKPGSFYATATRDGPAIFLLSRLGIALFTYSR